MGSSRSISESSVMLADRTQQGISSSSKNPGKSNNLKCSHCGQPGHLKQRCYELIGYPEWWDLSKKPRKKIAGKAMVTSVEDTQLNVEDKLQPQPIANVAYPEEMNEQFGIPEIENEVSVPASVPLEVGPESQIVPLENRSESLMLAELR
ncbi:hypothetical protein GH714_031900 [Hevea brasiliensis]|uniref:CCHC-type domain-containing protein n=1 Tax=Hevea brasiliensis TaxID=3981 RepID=A0A6A6K8T3_HEVBR|nr:hypothetical protein GH714_031900 [Hevea brasiliensis]